VAQLECVLLHSLVAQFDATEPGRAHRRAAIEPLEGAALPAGVRDLPRRKISDGSAALYRMRC
jgi:hypothetical protein